MNVPSEQVLMQIKDDPSLKWPEEMKGDPNKCNRNKYCRFYRDHGHDTDECFDLKQQIKNLIRQGKLRNFLGRDYKDEKLKAKVEELSQPLLGEIKMIVEVKIFISIMPMIFMEATILIPIALVGIPLHFL